MFEKYIPFVVSTKYSGEVSVSPSAINFNVVNPGNSIWIHRHRYGQWPPELLIDNIVNYGCILVPIGPTEIENSELLWRISFSMAEKQLSHSMNYTQILCYALLRLSLKNIIFNI
jgi:hypothetical protein